MDYVLQFVPILWLTAIEALSLSVLAGRLDVICMCQAAFVGVGAYVTAILTTRAHLSMMIGIPMAVLVGCVFGWFFGLVTASLDKERLALATLAFQLLFSSVVVNWTAVTSGPEGISGIPQFAYPSFVLVAAMLAILLVTSFLLQRTLLGRIGDVMRESDSFAAACGFSTTAARSWHFAVGAGAASLGGALFAHRSSYIDPGSFSLGESVFLLSAVLIGGDKGWRGVLGGVALVTVIPEVLRFSPLQVLNGGQVRQVLYGVALLVVLLAGPRGVQAHA